MRKMHSLLARFFDKVEENGAPSCWPWLATKDKAGYGYFNIRNAERCRKIAAEYGLGHNQVSRIKKGERWGNLEVVK